MRALLSLVAVCGLAAFAQAQLAKDEVEVRWRGTAYAESALPEHLAPGAKVAVRAWADLALQNAWKLELDAQGRVLFVTDRRSSHAAKYLRRVEQVAAEIDDVLPPVVRTQASAKRLDGARKSDSDSIPEDPEEPPVNPLDVDLDDSGPATWTWGTAERVFDQETAVLFVLRDEAGIDPVLTRLVELHPYLEAWMPDARKLAGWSLEQPLAGLCYEMPSGVEEWNVENEIVHRTAELLTLRRFGPLPPWLTQGLAWSIEMRLTKSIYCFPGRTGFVWATEHGSWPNDLQRRFGDREKGPLAITDLTALRRNAYEPTAAPLAWGFVEFLRREHAAGLRQLAEALRARRDEENRIDHGNNNWSRDPNYRMSDEVQRELLLEHCGATILEAAPRYLSRIR